MATSWGLAVFARFFWRSKGVREARLLEEDVTLPQATVRFIDDWTTPEPLTR